MERRLRLEGGVEKRVEFGKFLLGGFGFVALLVGLGFRAGELGGCVGGGRLPCVYDVLDRHGRGCDCLGAFHKGGVFALTQKARKGFKAFRRGLEGKLRGVTLVCVQT